MVHNLHCKLFRRPPKYELFFWNKNVWQFSIVMAMTFNDNRRITTFTITTSTAMATILPFACNNCRWLNWLVEGDTKGLIVFMSVASWSYWVLAWSAFHRLASILTCLAELSGVAERAAAGVGEAGILVQHASCSVLALVVVAGVDGDVAVGPGEARRALAIVAVTRPGVRHAGRAVLAEVAVAGVELGLAVCSGVALRADTLVLGEAEHHTGPTVEAWVGVAWCVYKKSNYDIIMHTFTIYCIRHRFSQFWIRCGNSQGLNFAIFLMFLLQTSCIYNFENCKLI